MGPPQKTMNEEMISKWRLIDHTADIRMQIFGKDFGDLLINGAVGMTSLLGSPTNEGVHDRVIIELEAGDREELLVDWLREILFYYNVRGFCFISALFHGLSHTGLRSQVTGLVYEAPFEPENDIKAVTYHGVEINETIEGLEAKVVFDI